MVQLWAHRRQLMQHLRGSHGRPEPVEDLACRHQHHKRDHVLGGREQQIELQRGGSRRTRVWQRLALEHICQGNRTNAAAAADTAATLAARNHWWRLLSRCGRDLWQPKAAALTEAVRAGACSGSATCGVGSGGSGRLRIRICRLDLHGIRVSIRVRGVHACDRRQELEAHNREPAERRRDDEATQRGQWANDDRNDRRDDRGQRPCGQEP